MNYKIDHCEPFDNQKENIWMKCEHCGRYLFAADYLSENKQRTVLDVASAEGYGTAILAERGLTVFAADINPAYIKHASERCKGSFFQIDLEKDDFPSEWLGIDAVVSFETIEHIDNARRFLENVWHILKQDGIFILSFPNSKYEKLDENGANYDPFHKRIFKKEEMLELITKTGFLLVEEYGQSLCNLLYKAEYDAIKSNRLSQKDIDDLFLYDEQSIFHMAKLIAYPNKDDIEQSYSNIWVIKKSWR